MNYRTRKRQQIKRQRLVTVLSFAVCLVATFFYIRSRLMVVETSYRYAILKKTLADATETNAKLRLAVAQLRAPQRIEALARTRLQLKAQSEVSSPRWVVEVVEDTPVPAQGTTTKADVGWGATW